MRVKRSNNHLPSVERGRQISLQFDGRKIQAYEGETILGVMMAEGQRVLRYTPKEGRPRGMFCGIGVCYDCLVIVDGIPNTRACSTMVTDGMVVETQGGRNNG
jgi:D-hydroxyproline dehydrogenase subunit gamma